MQDRERHSIPGQKFADLLRCSVRHDFGNLETLPERRNERGRAGAAGWVLRPGGVGAGRRAELHSRVHGQRGAVRGVSQGRLPFFRGFFP